MSILSWNCRGLGNPTAIRVLADLVRSKRPTIIFLMETFADTRRMESIRVQVGYKNMFVVNSAGHSGGLALLWKDDVALEVVGFSHNHIDSTIQDMDDGPEWRFTGYYGHLEKRRIKDSWQLLRNLSNLNSLPWAIMGDFNDLLDNTEKRGRTNHPTWLLRGFKETVKECGLKDLPFSGYQFTWERSRGTPAWVEEKLDRIMVTDTWLEIFAEVHVESIMCSYSDHLPLFMQPVRSTCTIRRRRFQFENAWLKEGRCREIVSFS